MLTPCTLMNLKMCLSHEQEYIDEHGVLKWGRTEMIFSKPWRLVKITKKPRSVVSRASHETEEHRLSTCSKGIKGTPKYADENKALPISMNDRLWEMERPRRMEKKGGKMLASQAIGSTANQKRKEQSDPSAEEQLYLDDTVLKKSRDDFTRTLQVMQDQVVRLSRAEERMSKRSKSKLSSEAGLPEERMPQRSQIPKSKGGGGASICENNRRRSACKECSGSSICEHNRRRSRCKQCGGASICEHNP